LNREEKFCKKNQTCDFTSWTCKTTQGRWWRWMKISKLLLLSKKQIVLKKI
jgi:hypothetical protein